MIDILKAHQKNVPDIVAIHKLAFPNFFLTTLGDSFLHLYYGSMCRNKDAVTLCAVEEGKMVGFATCSYYSRGFNKSLIRKNLFKFGFEFLKLLFTRPGAILRLLKNLNKESDDVTQKDCGDYAELYSIAVSPSCQGKGVGKKLLLRTEEEVKKHNRKLSLTSDYYNNDKTISFYHSLGYQDYYEFITYPDRRMWRLIKRL